MQTDTILKQYGLAKNMFLEVYGFETEEDWHKLRQKGIGGSDIGAIMGLNKYSSPLQVYKSKVEGRIKDLSDKVSVRKGKDLESLIRTLYVIPHFLGMGYEVQNLSHHSIINTQYPYLRGNLDGIAKCIEDPEDFTKHFVIEIKFVTQFAEDAWDNEDYCGVPPSYYAQVQEYMAITGMRKAYVCAMFERTWICKFYEIPFDSTFVMKLLKVAEDFYNYNMLMKIPPRVTIGIDSEDILEMTKGLDEVKEDFIADASLNIKMSEYKDLDIKIKELTKRRDVVKSELVDAYLKGNIPSSPLHTLKVSSYKSTRLDTAKLKADRPDIYEQYSVESETVKVIIK